MAAKRTVRSNRVGSASVSTLFGTATGGPSGAPFTVPARELHRRIERSAIWAAFGDALGFPSELVDEAGLRRRTGVDHLTDLPAWRRKVGGRSGAMAELPAGTYSDDTQLRMATARCIGPSGFDVEAFASVELAIWPAYALGGGKGTKAAATAIARVSSTWYNNPFPGWERSGGNGAVMRIQPHVWASPSPDPESYLLDVMRNAITTHSNPVGMIGAGLHAICLAFALENGRAPEPDDVSGALDALRGVPELISEGIEGGMWRHLWEEAAKRDFAGAWHLSLDDAKTALHRIHGNTQPSAIAYAECLDVLGLRTPELRGSGTLTALAACWLAWTSQSATTAISLAANALGSDTDSIATMAGALLGPGESAMPAGTVQDQPLLLEEAGRLAAVGHGQRARPFRYPDLLRWVAPQSQGDVLGVTEDGDLAVRGLGPCLEIDDQPAFSPKGDFAWIWVRLWYGQTLLIKRRRELATIPQDQLPPVPKSEAKERPSSPEAPMEALAAPVTTQQQGDRTILLRPKDRGVSLDSVFNYLAAEPLTDDRVGYAIARVARDGSNDDLRQFVGTLREMLRADPS